MNEKLADRGPTLLRRLGLSPLGVAALALLAVPRVIAHDLGLVDPGFNLVLVFAPPLVWLVVVLARRVPSPLTTLSAVGLGYGVLLAITHQLLWGEAFGGDVPTLGGSLAGTLSPGWEEVVLRGFACVSSVVTGFLVGVVTGVVAWGLATVPALTRR